MNFLILLTGLSLVLAFVTSVVIFTNAQRTNEPNPVIHGIDCIGSVEGIWETVNNSETGEQRRVAKFMGIPYANPPLGNLRFKAPVPFNQQCVSSSSSSSYSSSSPWNGTYYRSVCPQFDMYGEGTKLIGEEDCLYIQAIYVPEKIYYSIKSGENRKFPTNVYIHGGSNMFGSGKNEKHGFFSAFYGEAYNDTYGAVDVVFNYRLSLLGFLMAPSFGEDDANFAIQDIIMVSKWVQKNIAVFGGDVNKMTLSGQSSGGTNIFALQATTQISGIYKAMYSMSGSANISMDRRSKIVQDLPVIQALGCASVSSPQQQIECLQKIPVDQLFKHVPVSWMTPSLCSGRDLNPSGKHYVGLPFVAKQWLHKCFIAENIKLFYIDGKILTTSFVNALESGMNSDVTLVISGQGQECNLFPNQIDLVNYTLPQWKNFLRTRVFQNFGSSSSSISEAVYKAYEKEAQQSAVDLAYFSLSADFSVNCANKKLAQIAGKNRKAPIFYSVNQWPPTWPNDQAKFSYAFHIWDYLMAMHMTFELDAFENFKPQKEDYDFSKLLRSQWYVLMNTGSLETWTNPYSLSTVKWLPANAAVNFPNEWNTFVYSRKDRFPFHQSQTVTSYKQKTCDMLESYGFGQNFWWCN